MDPQGFIQDYIVRKVSWGTLDAGQAAAELFDKQQGAWLVRLSSITDMFCVSVREADKISHFRFPANTSWTDLTDVFGTQNNLYPYVLTCGTKWSQVMARANQETADMQKEREKR